MSRIDRRDMLKAMAATAVGAAVSGTGVESVLAASPNPTGPVLGTQPGSAATGASKILAGSPTPFTTYTSFPGSDFDAGASAYTWSVSGPIKFPTNGGFFVRRLQVPQGAIITECIFYVSHTTASVTCNLISGVINTGVINVFATATAAASATVPELVTLTVPPTAVDNIGSWYELDVETGAATNDGIYSARIGYLKQPGLTLFPDPRRIVNGFTTPFASGGSYGPFDATFKSDLVTASGVPANATAVFCAVQSYNTGVLTLYPDGTTDPGFANYTAPGSSALNLTYMMIPLGNAGKFRIHSYITGNCFVDAWGYLI